MREIKMVKRYGTYTGDYVYYVHYWNGDIDQYVSGNLPKEVKMFMGAAEFEFCKSASGEYYDKFY